MRVGDDGLANVTLKLLDDTNAPLDAVVTDADGNYDFGTLAVGNYSIMIVEPLGYLADANPKPVVVADATPHVVDFALTEVVVGNNARKLSYWKHQFDVHVTGRGRFDETAAQLQSYIDAVHQHYTPHFDIFANHLTFENWQEALSRDRNIPPYIDLAMQQIAALVMNFASLKIGQYSVVTDDGRTAGDVLTYVSQLFTDPSSGMTEFHRARTLAKKVNDDKRIDAGEVPAGNVLYKGGTRRTIHWGFDTPTEYSLSQNYPNPFNPTTHFGFQIAEFGLVTLKVYNVLGQEVATLVNEEMKPGTYRVTWNAREQSSGVYFYRLSTTRFVQTRKLMLLR